jgi:hypothetical protein
MLKRVNCGILHTGRVEIAYLSVKVSIIGEASGR